MLLLRILLWLELPRELYACICIPLLVQYLNNSVCNRNEIKKAVKQYILIRTDVETIKGELQCKTTQNEVKVGPKIRVSSVLVF